ncbi:MAG: lamin tail domain-containing protein [Myxococcota bacterium]
MRRLALTSMASVLLLIPACGGDGGGDAPADASPDGAEAVGGDVSPDVSPDEGADVAPDLPPDDGGPGDVPPDEVDDADTPDDGGGEVEDAAPDVPGGDADAGPDAPETTDAPDVEPDATPECGDGDVEGDEQCDEGDDNSDTAPDACRTDCTLPGCGDGVKDSGEACDDGDLDDTDACTSACEAGPDLSRPAPGQVVVTELMINPAAAEDPAGEWIELHNPGEADLSLVGCTLRDEGTDEVVLGEEGDLVAPAGGHLVLGFSDDPEANGGAPVDLAHGGMLLDNVADEVVLECDGSVVDSVAWDADGWPVAAGVAMALDAGADAEANDAPEAWCGAEAPYGDGDLGTPGDANPACPVPDVEVDLCRVVSAPSLEVFAGLSAPITVEVEEAGLTDATAGVDLAAGLLVQVGAGPDGSTPDETWQWDAAAPAEGWSDEGGVDAWAGASTLPEVGTFDAAARVSLDGGATWTTCDRGEGSADGYQPEQSVAVTVLPNPCDGVLCDTPPVPRCASDGVRVLTFDDEGTCEVEVGEATCAYPVTAEDCAAAGQVCRPDATCGGSAPAPAEHGDVVVTEIMVLPKAGFGMSGQWFEVHNPGAEPLDLAGCVLGYGAEDHEVTSPVVVGAGGYAVLGRSASKPLNGGVEVDYAYGDDLAFAEAGAPVTVTCGDVGVDSVGYEGDTWPVVAGASLSLSPYERDAETNDSASVWCTGSEPFGFGDLGTPGEENTACPGDEEGVDACRILPPAAVEAPAGTQVSFEARLEEQGVTDGTTGTDADPAVRVQLGHRPGGGAFTWTDAEPDSLWDSEEASAPPAEDAWLGALTAPAPGGYEVLFRVSVDFGHTWRLCGLDGAGSPEDPPEVVGLTSVGSPCHPSPCEADPGPGCDGDMVVSRALPATCSVEGGAAVCQWTEEPLEDCGVLGGTCEEGACVGLPVAPAGSEMVISEILVAPAAGELAEWVELANVTDSTLDLSGCLLASGAEAWTIHHDNPAATFVEPGARVVLARTEEPEGATPDLVYGSGVAFDNAADVVHLVCEGDLVDAVGWDVAEGWPVEVGAAMALSAPRTDTTTNDAPEAWCAHDGDGAVGTPGAENPVCPPLDAGVDACWLEGPASVTVDAATDVEVAGLVRDGWTTDATDGTDMAPGLRAQVAWGSAGADPSEPDSGFEWSDAAPDDAWVDDSAAGDVDRWVGAVTPDEVGSMRLVARFSADDGATWTVCDLDGSANGYADDQAGALEVSPTACIPNPCTAPPDLACDGDLLTIGTGDGVCTPPAEEGGEPTCDYPADTFDCASWGGCADGACVDPVPGPAAAGEIVVTEVMRDSLLPAPDAGEWVEVLNTTDGLLDLRGCLVHDLDGESHAIEGPLPVAVEAGGRLVLAASGTPADLGGVEPGYVWADLTLGNVFDELVLSCGEVVVDEVAWAADWPGAEGVSMQLSSDLEDEVENDLPGSWCASEAPYGDGSQLGTPGADNAVCPAP